MKSLFDKRARISLSIILTLIIFPLIAISQVSRSHTITVIVNTITVMQVSVGTVDLNITGANAIAGQDAMSVTDQSSTLLWGTNSSAQKITIRTNLTPQKFAVMALAISPTYGLAASEVTLSTTPKDFLLNIGRSSGSTSIRYTGIALASQGTGTDSHLITLTIVAQ
jgi:hypothetical protein